MGHFNVGINFWWRHVALVILYDMDIRTYIFRSIFFLNYLENIEMDLNGDM